MGSQFYLPPTHEPYTCLCSPAARRHRPLDGTHCAYPRRDGQAELTRVTGHISMYFSQFFSTCLI